MEYTSKFFVEFLKKLVVFDKDSQSLIDAASHVLQSRDESEKAEWNKTRSVAVQRSQNNSLKVESIISDFQSKIERLFSSDLDEKRSEFSRLQKCKEALAMVSSAENSITDKNTYNANKGSSVQQVAITVDEILQGKVDFVSLAYDVNVSLKNAKRKNATAICSSFYSTCRTAETLLNQEITLLRGVIIRNVDSLHSHYSNVGDGFCREMASEWTTITEGLNETSRGFASQRESSRNETDKVYNSNSDALKQRLGKLVDSFCKQFPPKEFADEYTRIYSFEPSYEKYECCHEMPKSVHISTLEYDISTLGLNDYTKAFLNRYYYFMYRGNKLCIPYCASFGPEFNYLFRFSGEGRSVVVKNACDLGMRLFMMLPPGKLNFTFIDPVTLGESFAMFTRLVDVDDRTSEVINGKIWSSPADIEEKLKIMTDHISNVTQRCLQGKYNNIFEYNRVAEQNAEAYQVLMLMDFPAGLTDQSLKLLEQIVTSGPKCGVFTIIYRNESQYKKVSERSHPLISNIENNFQVFDYSGNSTNITCSGETVKDKKFLWNGLNLPGQAQMDNIIATIKKGIKGAEKVVIGIEKVSAAETTHTTKDGIRIPIGIHGANEVQYLTLGVGGSHHALIAGVAGSGKSSLLHTVILRTLTQYSPDELSVYLVDFKRGVEFKIYADFVLPSFKVVAIESEREFGYNILVALEREQKIRADLFKKSHVDKIEEYRELGKKMPRILVIMDEFHELFSNANDLAKVLQLYLNDGSYGGEQLLSAETVRLFTQTKSPTCRRGLGFDKPATGGKASPCGSLASPSVYGHTGFTGTCFWVDPDQQLIYIFLSNRVYPTRSNNKLSSLNIRTRIQDTIYKAIEKKEL